MQADGNEQTLQTTWSPMTQELAAQTLPDQSSVGPRNRVAAYWGQMPAAWLPNEMVKKVDRFTQKEMMTVLDAMRGMEKHGQRKNHEYQERMAQISDRNFTATSAPSRPMDDDG